MPHFANDERARESVIDLIFKLDALELGEPYASKAKASLLAMVQYCQAYGRGLKDQEQQDLLKTLGLANELRQEIKASIKGGELEMRPAKRNNWTAANWRQNLLEWAAENLPEAAAVLETQTTRGTQTASPRSNKQKTATKIHDPLSDPKVARMLGFSLNEDDEPANEHDEGPESAEVDGNDPPDSEDEEALSPGLDPAVNEEKKSAPEENGSTTTQQELSVGSETASEQKRAEDVPQSLLIGCLVPHPDNPRIRFNPELVQKLAAQMKAAGRFEARHAITVRLRKSEYEILSGHSRVEAAKVAGLQTVKADIMGEYEILSGHTRVEAAKVAGLQTVVAWIVDVPDTDALMLLALDNAQEPLTHLELGLHSFKVVDQTKSSTLSAFAKKMGLDPSNLSRYRHGAQVYLHVVGAEGGSGNFTPCRELAEHLAAIHKAPREQWVALVKACLAQEWTITQAKCAAKAAFSGETRESQDEASTHKDDSQDQVESRQYAGDASDVLMEPSSATVGAAPTNEPEHTKAPRSSEKSSVPAPLTASIPSDEPAPPLVHQANVPNYVQESEDNRSEESAKEETSTETEKPVHNGHVPSHLKNAVSSVKSSLQKLSEAGDLAAHANLLRDLIDHLRQALAKATNSLS